jgi:hypothetical protein
MDKDIVVLMVTAAAIVVICITTVLPLSIMRLRRTDRTKQREQLPASDIIARLERMELGMEAMSTQIERIGEGQRFTTKLLQTTSAWGSRPALDPANTAPRSD